jgi:geranylgeranyl diphosphate synthase, type II
MDILKNMQDAFEAHLLKNSFTGNPESIYAPVNYLMQIGGKRIRPLSLLLAYSVFKPDWEKVMNQALAIEVFHNFTLAHDDIMDEAILRRGRPTMHVAYNTNTAILGGDLMLILSYQLLCGDGRHSAFSAILEVFSQGGREICEGQQLDMEFERMEWVSIAEYETMIRLKTAVLLGVSMKIGGLLADADMHSSQALYDFAVNLGMAFQIQDDWLDTFGDNEKVGKTRGGDILRNKKTFLWASFMEQATDEDKQAMLDCIPIIDESVKIENTMMLYRKYDVSARCKQRQEFYYGEALDSLHRIELSIDISLLKDFASLVINRQF